MGLSGVRALVMLLAGVVSSPAAGVALTTVIENGQTGPLVIEGDSALMEHPASMASTFKVFLAWVALEEGLVDLTTRRRVADRHVPGSPREISLAQAMYHSSNDFFIDLLPEATLQRLPERLVQSGLAEMAPAGWLQGDPRAICSGGNLRVTPKQNHQFMLRVVQGQLTSNPVTQSALEAVCRWPSPDTSHQVFGKTGTMTGAVWFNGFARHLPSGKSTVRTIFIPGKLSQRAQAISWFYQGLGLSWDPHAWTQWLE